MYFWGLLLLSAPLVLLLEVLGPIPLFGHWGHLPWVSAWVVYYALHQKLPAACCAALLGGLLVDGFRLGQPGTTLFTYGLTVFLADRFRRQIVPDASITAAVFGMVTSTGVSLFGLGLLLMDAHRGLSPIRVGGKLLFTLVASGVLTPLVCLLLQRVHRALDLVATEEDQHVNA